MRKKITRYQVRLGMFIDALEGKWLDHPFWRKRFILEDPGDVAALRDSKVTGVWIDTSKGGDVELERAEAEPEAVKPAPEVPAAQPKSKASCSAEAEMRRASQVLDHARPVVKTMFDEARMGKLPELSDCLPVVEDISASVARNASALTSLVRLKTQDEYTYMHSVAVCALMAALAMELKLSEDTVREAAVAGLLHDVGKARIPLEILNKPGQLTQEEFAIMREHPRLGYEMLTKLNELPQSVLEVCLYHHERVDGRGYPEQKSGSDLSLLIRMSAICDVYDAVTSARSYKAPWEPPDALSQMASWKGHFDDKVFRRFVKCIGIYPLGSLVSLSGGKLAVVIEHRPEQLTKPVVKVFFSTKSKMAVPVEVVDLSRPRCTDQILGREAPAKWGLDPQRIRQLWA